MRFLLLQIRNPDDPMRQQEVQSFSRALGVPLQAISVFDLLGEALRPEDLEAADVFLLGGSGDYSAAVDAPWLDRALDDLRLLHRFRKPTFASCWGFQAMARAMGGRVVHDPNRAEIGTIELTLTDAGRKDPLFGPLGSPFSGHAGHEDCVDELPPNATLLASSERVRHQAYVFNDAPIYCTQFHPELNCADLEARVRRYPKYAERIAGITVDEFSSWIRETPGTEALLARFVRWATGHDPNDPSDTPSDAPRREPGFEDERTPAATEDRSCTSPS